jgi:hypothetical protein
MNRNERAWWRWSLPLLLPVVSWADEIQSFELSSEYLKAPVCVEVVLPENYVASERHAVVYVLAAEPGVVGNRGLAEIRRLGLATQHDVICVGVNFDTMPWYGDHATDPGIRHESHLLHRVIPAVDRRYATRVDRDGRWLLGFSKSGWGAFTLLLRSPGTFGFAASWDAPLMFTAQDFGVYRTAPHFGTVETFAGYLPSGLARRPASGLRDRPRFVLAGSALFGGEPDGRFAATPHLETMHQIFEGAAVPHRYVPGLDFPHRWDSGWLEPVFRQLVEIARRPTPAAAGGQLVQ